jgi:methionyl-tRNA synthetase
MSLRPRRTILVTSALPYANGAPHLGHIVEYVQTDIWVRFQRLRGHDCLYVCASDAHGTPIMLKARQEGVTPEALIERFGAVQRRDFADFGVSFDNFHTTHSPENREVTETIYRRLLDGGHIRRATIRQAYDAQAQMFLPDRYLPALRHARPVRRQLRVLRRHLHAGRPAEPGVGGERHAARATRLRAPVFQAG